MFHPCTQTWFIPIWRHRTNLIKEKASEELESLTDIQVQLNLVYMFLDFDKKTGVFEIYILHHASFTQF